MTINFINEVKQLASRIEGSLIFTLVRFLYALYRGAFDNVTVALINLCTLLVSFSLLYTLQHYKFIHNQGGRSLVRLLKLIQKFSTLILTQTLIKSVQPMDLENSNVVTLLQCLVSSVSLVIILTLLPREFHHSDNGQQFMRLVLFMFTDNTEFLVKRIAFGWTLPFLSATGFIFLYHTSEWYKDNAILVTLTKAFNLSLTNLMILSNWTVDIGSTEQTSQLTQLLGLLILFDALQDIYPEFSAMRDYAIWQGAAQVYNISKFEHLGGIELLVACIFVIFVFNLVFRLKSLVELSILIIINIILGNITSVVSTIHSHDVVTIVTLWLTVIEVVLESMRG